VFFTDNVHRHIARAEADKSGPFQLALHESKSFTATPNGGVAPYQYFWSMRFYSPTFGWGAWSTPFEGSATTYASSNGSAEPGAPADDVRRVT
jgi:hypothetical protein